MDVKHEDHGEEGKSNEVTERLNKNSSQHTTNTQQAGYTRPSILAKASSTGFKSTNEEKLNTLAKANTGEGAETLATLVMDWAEPKTRRLVTSENKSKAQGQEGGVGKVTPTTGGCATHRGEVDTLVLEATASLTRLGVSGKEVGLAQPKTRGLDETKVSVQAKQLKITADWRSMGNHLSKWLKNRPEPKSGEPPLGHMDTVQTQATAPAGSV